MPTRRNLIAMGAAILATPAFAQTATPKLVGSPHEFFKRRKRVAVPAYHVTYITQQQGTAAASIGARTRLNLMLEGLDETTMQRMADAAHADLIAKLKAAGFDVLPDAEARALAAEVEAAPGNRDVVAVGPSITIGKSVKIGWTAMGAQAAPLLKPFHNPTSPTGAIGFASFGATGKLGAAARQADAVAIVPALVVDFAEMEAKTGSDFLGRASAGVSSALRFGLRASSNATLASAYDKGPAFAGNWRLDKDLTLVGPFASVQEGAAAVRVGTLTAQADSNYQMKDRARGDAVVVDLPVWEKLMTEAYGAYNTALVDAATKARG